MKVIDGHALAEDFKVDRMNLFMNGLKGTPREYCISLDNVIERIEDAPPISIEDISEEILKLDKVILKKTDADLLEQYKKLGHIVVHPDNTVTIIDTPKTEYIDKTVSRVFQNMAYRHGVRELRDRITKYIHTEMDLSKELTATDIHQLVWKIASECLSERSYSNVTESTEV